MIKRPDNLLFLSGLLLGLGVGLLFGLFLLIWGITFFFMHHMFILGIQWSSIGFLTVFVAVPMSLIVAGLVTRRKILRPGLE